ncbi:MAG: type II secretion system protein GspD [Verrucomicrobiia bacterium]
MTTRLLKLLCIASAVVVGLSACQTSSPKPTKTASEKKVAGKSDEKASAPKPKYNTQFDKEFKEIFDLASKNRWDDAMEKVKALEQKAPNDEQVIRVKSWVEKQRNAYLERNVEDKIREIDAKNSSFNPSIIDVFTENKDRGLQPRKDIRDAIQKIESEPYIPESFGKKVYSTNRLFDIESPEGKMAKILNKEISVHLDNVTLEAIIFNIGQAEGINFVADKSIPAFKQTLSVNMDKVKLGEFLKYVARNLDVQFQVGEDLIWIIDGKDPKKLMEETRFYKLRHGFIIPAQFGPDQVTKTVTAAGNVVTTIEKQDFIRFVNDNAPPIPAIERAITNFFTGSKYFIDYERNIIVARGTREQLEVMDKIVQEFDKPLQQVLIEARFITVTEAAFLQLGAMWETGRPVRGGRTPQDYTGLGTFSGLENDYSAGIQKTWTNIFPKILGQSDLTATLTALQQSGESQTLSAPRLTLVNNLPAMISDGKIQYYYEQYTVKQTIGQYITASSLVPEGKPTKITSGVSLYVVASVGGDGKTILLAINPKVNQDVEMKTFATVRDVSGSFEIKLPESRTQELATRVLVKSGQTVVMGGVLEREQRKFVESVPILGNIPIIGAAFRRRTEYNKPRYLLVFVTATLLNENGEMVIPAEQTSTPTKTTP